MTLPDVNVLVYAHKRDSPRHEEYLAYLTSLVENEPFALAHIILSGFVRVTTSPKIMKPPSTLTEALAFSEGLRERKNCTVIAPGSSHWVIFTDLCKQTNARGNDVTDAYLAALTIEHGCEFVTADKGFARFPGLRWRHPLGS